jgi:transglutaminase-like putative cysteine protease
MRKLRWSLVAFAASALPLPSVAVAQTEAPSAIPIETKLYDERVEVNGQGLATDTVHFRVRANNAASAQRIGQQPILYSETMNDIDIVEAFTLKADGRKIPVAPTAIFTQMPQGDAQAIMFDDSRQKVVVFPDVEAGDTIEMTYRRRDKQAAMPGQFSFGRVFSPTAEADSADITIVAPQSYPLFVETHNIPFDRHDSNGTTTYHWHFAQRAPAATIQLDRVPSILVSSFKDYEVFGHTYAGLVRPTIAVTPAIQTLADQITQGTNDHRAKAEKIYDWVSRHIRYVAVEMGVGGYMPHGADSILANGYGDCKDHAVLFSALLKAAGISSELVLINSQGIYALPATAVPGAFDHVIAWLPEFGLYADTTAGVAPFGSLPFTEYGKPVLHATEAGKALRAIPVLPPGLATAHTQTVAHIDATGKFEGTTTTTASGPYSMTLRMVTLTIESIGVDVAANAVLKRANLEGNAVFVNPSPPEDLGPSYSLTNKWSFGPYADVLRGARYVMPEGIPVLSLPGDFLMGPLNNAKPDNRQPIACYSGHNDEDIFLDAPAGYQFLQSPPDSTVRTAHISFSTHWSQSGKTLHLHRDFTSTIDTPLCTGAVLTEAINALAAIRQSYRYGFAIAPAGTTPVAQAGEEMRVADAAPMLNSGEMSVASLLPAKTPAHSEAMASVFAPHELPDTTTPVGKAAASDSTTDVNALTRQIGLRSAMTVFEQRGMARTAHGRFDDATSDFTKALNLASNDNDISRIRAERASSYWFARDWRPALNDYAEAARRNPANAEAVEGLGRSELFAGRNASAVADLSKAVSLKPDDSLAKLWLAIAQSHAGKSVDVSSVSSLPGPATDPKTVCAKEFFFGEFALAVGEGDAARKHFLASRAAGTDNQVEFVAAGIELGRLK